MSKRPSIFFIRVSIWSMTFQSVLSVVVLAPIVRPDRSIGHPVSACTQAGRDHVMCGESGRDKLSRWLFITKGIGRCGLGSGWDECDVRPGPRGNAAAMRVLPKLIVIADWCAGFFGAGTLVLEHERARQQCRQHDVRN